MAYRRNQNYTSYYESEDPYTGDDRGCTDEDYRARNVEGENSWYNEDQYSVQLYDDYAQVDSYNEEDQEYVGEDRRQQEYVGEDGCQTADFAQQHSIPSNEYSQADVYNEQSQEYMEEQRRQTAYCDRQQYDTHSGTVYCGSDIGTSIERSELYEYPCDSRAYSGSDHIPRPVQRLYETERTGDDLPENYEQNILESSEDVSETRQSKLVYEYNNTEFNSEIENKYWYDVKRKSVKEVKTYRERVLYDREIKQPIDSGRHVTTFRQSGSKVHGREDRATHAFHRGNSCDRIQYHQKNFENRPIRKMQGIAAPSSQQGDYESNAESTVPSGTDQHQWVYSSDTSIEFQKFEKHHSAAMVRKREPLIQETPVFVETTKVGGSEKRTQDRLQRHKDHRNLDKEISFKNKSDKQMREQFRNMPSKEKGGSKRKRVSLLPTPSKSTKGEIINVHSRPFAAFQAFMPKAKSVALLPTPDDDEVDSSLQRPYRHQVLENQGVAVCPSTGFLPAPTVSSEEDTDASTTPSVLSNLTWGANVNRHPEAQMLTSPACSPIDMPALEIPAERNVETVIYPSRGLLPTPKHSPTDPVPNQSFLSDASPSVDTEQFPNDTESVKSESSLKSVSELHMKDSRVVLTKDETVGKHVVRRTSSPDDIINKKTVPDKAKKETDVPNVVKKQSAGKTEKSAEMKMLENVQVQIQLAKAIEDMQKTMQTLQKKINENQVAPDDVKGGRKVNNIPTPSQLEKIVDTENVDSINCAQTVDAVEGVTSDKTDPVAMETENLSTEVAKELDENDVIEYSPKSGSQTQEVFKETASPEVRGESTNDESQGTTSTTEDIDSVENQSHKAVNDKSSTKVKRTDRGEFRTYREWRLAKERMNQYFIEKHEDSRRQSCERNQDFNVKNTVELHSPNEFHEKELLSYAGNKPDDKNHNSENSVDIKPKTVIETKKAENQSFPLKESEKKHLEKPIKCSDHLKTSVKTGKNVIEYNPEMNDKYENSHRQSQQSSDSSLEKESAEKLKEKPYISHRERKQSDNFKRRISYDESDRNVIEDRKQEHLQRNRHKSSECQPRHHWKEDGRFTSDRLKSKSIHSDRSEKHRNTQTEKSHRHHHHDKYHSSSKEKEKTHSSMKTGHGFKSKEYLDKPKESVSAGKTEISNSSYVQRNNESKFDSSKRGNLFEKMAMENEIIDVVGGISSEEEKVKVVAKIATSFNESEGQLKNIFAKLGDISRNKGKDSNSKQVEEEIDICTDPVGSEPKRDIPQSANKKVPSVKLDKTVLTECKSKQDLKANSTSSAYHYKSEVSEDSSTDADPFEKMNFFLNKDKRKAVSSILTKSTKNLDDFIVSDDHVSEIESSDSSMFVRDQQPSSNSIKKGKDSVKHLRRENNCLYWKKIKLMFPRICLKRLQSPDIKRLKSKLKKKGKQGECFEEKRKSVYENKNVFEIIREQEEGSRIAALDKDRSVEDNSDVGEKVGGNEGRKSENIVSPQKEFKLKEFSVVLKRTNMETRNQKCGDQKYGDLKCGDKKYGDQKYGDQKCGDQKCSDSSLNLHSNDKKSSAEHTPENANFNSSEGDNKLNASINFSRSVHDKESNNDHSSRKYKRIMPVCSSTEQSESSDIERIVQVSQRLSQKPVITDSDESEELEGSLGSEDSTCFCLTDQSEEGKTEETYDETKQTKMEGAVSELEMQSDSQEMKSSQSSKMTEAFGSIKKDGMSLFKNKKKPEDLIRKEESSIVDSGSSDTQTNVIRKPLFKKKRNIFIDIDECSSKNKTESCRIEYSKDTEVGQDKIPSRSSASLAKISATFGKTLKNVKMENTKAYSSEDSTGPSFCCLQERQGFIKNFNLNDTSQSESNITIDQSVDEVDGMENTQSESSINVNQSIDEIDGMIDNEFHKGKSEESSEDGEVKSEVVKADSINEMMTCSESARKTIGRKFNDSSSDTSDNEELSESRSARKYRRKLCEQNSDGKCLEKSDSKDGNNETQRKYGTNGCENKKHIRLKAKRLFKSTVQNKRQTTILQMDGNADPVLGPPDESSGEEGDVEDNVTYNISDSDHEDGASQDLFADLPEKLKVMSQNFKKLVNSTFPGIAIKTEVEDKDIQYDLTDKEASGSKVKTEAADKPADNTGETNNIAVIEIDKSDDEVKDDEVKNEPDWLKYGYTQELDTIFLSDDDEMIMSVSQPAILISDDDTQDPNTAQEIALDSVKQEKNDFHENHGSVVASYENFSSAEDWSDEGSDFEPENMFSSFRKTRDETEFAKNSDHNLSGSSLLSEDDLFKSQSILEPNNASKKDDGFDSSDGAGMSIDEDELLGSPASNETSLSNINEDELLGITQGTKTGEGKGIEAQAAEREEASKDFSSDSDEILLTTAFDLESNHIKRTKLESVVKMESSENSEQVKPVYKNQTRNQVDGSIGVIVNSENKEDRNPVVSTDLDMIESSQRFGPALVIKKRSSLSDKSTESPANSEYQEMTPYMQDTQADPDIDEEDTSNSVTAFDFYSENFADTDTDSKTSAETVLEKNTEKTETGNQHDYDTFSDDSDITIFDNSASENEVKSKLRHFSGVTQDKYSSETQVQSAQSDKSLQQDVYFTHTQVEKPVPIPDVKQMQAKLPGSDAGSGETQTEMSETEAYDLQTQTGPSVPAVYQEPTQTDDFPSIVFDEETRRARTESLDEQTQDDKPGSSVYEGQTQVDEAGPSYLTPKHDMDDISFIDISDSSVSDEDPQLQTYFQKSPFDKKAFREKRFSQSFGVEFDSFSDSGEEEFGCDTLTQVDTNPLKQEKQGKSKTGKGTKQLLIKKSIGKKKGEKSAKRLLPQAVHSSTSDDDNKYEVMTQVDKTDKRGTVKVKDRKAVKTSNKKRQKPTDNNVYLAATQFENVIESENEDGYCQEDDMYFTGTQLEQENDTIRLNSGVRNGSNIDKVNDSYFALTQLEDISEPEHDLVRKDKDLIYIATKIDVSINADRFNHNEDSGIEQARDRYLAATQVENISEPEQAGKEDDFYYRGTQIDEGNDTIRNSSEINKVQDSYVKGPHFENISESVGEHWYKNDDLFNTDTQIDNDVSVNRLDGIVRRGSKTDKVKDSYIAATQFDSVSESENEQQDEDYIATQIDSDISSNRLDGKVSSGSKIDKVEDSYIGATQYENVSESETEQENKDDDLYCMATQVDKDVYTGKIGGKFKSSSSIGMLKDSPVRKKDVYDFPDSEESGSKGSRPALTHLRNKVSQAATRNVFDDISDKDVTENGKRMNDIAIKRNVNGTAGNNFFEDISDIDNNDFDEKETAKSRNDPYLENNDAYCMETQYDELPDIISEISESDENFMIATTKVNTSKPVSVNENALSFVRKNSTVNESTKQTAKSANGGKGILKRPFPYKPGDKTVSFEPVSESSASKKPRIIEIGPQKLKTTAEKKASCVQSVMGFYKGQKSANLLNTASSSSDIEVTDIRKPDMWLSKKVGSKTVIGKGRKSEKFGKRKRSGGGDDDLRARMMAARSQLKQRSFHNITNPDSIKRLKTAPSATVTASELEDVTMPTNSQIIQQGLPLLNSTDVIFKKKQSAEITDIAGIVLESTEAVSVNTTTVSNVVSSSEPHTVQSTSVSVSSRVRPGISDTGKDQKHRKKDKENNKIKDKSEVDKENDHQKTKEGKEKKKSQDKNRKPSESYHYSKSHSGKGKSGEGKENYKKSGSRSDKDRYRKDKEKPSGNKDNKGRHGSGQKNDRNVDSKKDRDLKEKSGEGRQRASNSTGKPDNVTSTKNDINEKGISDNATTFPSVVSTCPSISNFSPTRSPTISVTSPSVCTMVGMLTGVTTVSAGPSAPNASKTVTMATTTISTCVSRNSAVPASAVRTTASAHIQSSVLLQKQSSKPSTSGTNGVHPVPTAVTSGRSPFQPLVSNIPGSVESLPSNMVANISNLQWNDFLKVILKWPPNWFEEREKIEQDTSTRRAPPPDVTNDLFGHSNHTLFPLLERYENYKEYSEKFMLPLLLHETWESCYSTWREMRSKQRLCKHKLMLFQQAQGGDKLQVYTLIGLISEKDKRSSNYVNEGDLVKLTMNGNLKDQQNVNYKMSGFIDRVIFKDLPVDRICAHFNDMAELRKHLGKDCMSIKLTVRVRLRAFTPNDKAAVNLESVSTLINKWRQFTALACLPKSPLCRDLLYPTGNLTYCDKAPAMDLGVQDKYNRSQLTAINTAAKIFCLPPEVARVCLLQGPPGTGKSHTIVGIIKHLVKVSQGRCRICLCAPSNAAVDELLRRLIKYNRTVGKNLAIKLVRLGKKNNIHSDIQSYCLDALVQKNIQQAQKEELLKKLPQSLAGERKALENKITMVTKKMEKATDQYQRQKLKTDLRKLEKEKQVLESKYVLPKTNVDPQQERQAKTNLLLKAHVIAGTLSTVGSNVLRSEFQGKTGPAFQVVIIDEATQAIELETLIPLQYGVTKLILVGDPEQLPATVLSQVAMDNKFNMSLFERLDSHFRYTPVNPVILLDTQYRMDPEISAFPNKYIYDGRIKDDRCVVERSQSPLVPYLLFDVNEGVEHFSQGTRSMSNALEAVFTAELCKFIVSESSVTERAIGIIAPYSNQKGAIINELRKRDLSAIEVSTVDGFQGREKDVIVMSCVRANVSGTVGFVGNRNRMNVLLTRAKYAMYLVGHFEALESSDEWKALIADAKQRQKIIQVNQSSMRRAIKQTLTQQNRDSSKGT